MPPEDFRRLRNISAFRGSPEYAIVRPEVARRASRTASRAVWRLAMSVMVCDDAGVAAGEEAEHDDADLGHRVHLGQVVLGVLEPALHRSSAIDQSSLELREVVEIVAV